MMKLDKAMAAALCAALSLQPACSFMLVKGPPDNHPDLQTFECTDSYTWPVLDTIWAGLNGIGAASALGDRENPDRDQIVGVGMSWLVLSGIAAIYGFSKASTCSDAKRLRDARLNGG
jgi:hypothetical protein